MAQKRSLSPEQDRAANPAENVWVQANAGTGKTSVLVQRLLRILFRAHDDGGILCLTYTNAGAGEMRNRILAALSHWARATDDELRDMLYGVSINMSPTAQDVAHAREIFFKYIDNPDLLKIKTIHGFCEEILHRFPMEAGLSPAWTLVSDMNQRVLLRDAFDRLVNSSPNTFDNSERITNAFAHIVGRVSEAYLDELLSILSSQYKYFFDIEDVAKYRKYFIDTTAEFLNILTPQKYDFDPESLLKIIDLADCAQKSSKKPVKYLDDVVSLTRQYIEKTIDFEKYKSAYLNADGSKKKSVESKEFLADEQNRVYEINQYNAARQIFDDTVALFDLSAAFAETYSDIKQVRNLLDFEDLILYTRRLFSSPETMGWVLSQLDLSLSHILVDEAQDTSPVQWDIMRMLAGDFFAEGDTNNTPHSIFVVGDTKQSIYGFQGADPGAFAASRHDISAQIQNNLRTIQEIPLTQSFRSLGPILRSVDEFFSHPAVVNETGFTNNKHACFRRDAGGLVELHKLISKQSDDIDVIKYCRIIADKIKSMIDAGECRACDIMVLLQKRHPMAAPLVVELKKRGIDVAGSDRIVLPNFPAVRDLMNLIRFCLDMTDDYSLCCVLKSPIFRLNEVDIFNICKLKNEQNHALKQAGSEFVPVTVFDILAQTHSQIYNVLTTMLDWAKNMGPYTFCSTVLNSNECRENMIAALGTQIIDPLDEFLTICLSYERTQPGTLRHFIKWFVTGGSEVKRDMDAAAGVRIATVHGSKGLEAPVVFLIDTVRTPESDQVLSIPANELSPRARAALDKYPAPWLWSPRANVCARYAVAANAAMGNDIAEYYRLLYVAMTRARDKLYIYGYTPYKNAPAISWHAKLWDILGQISGVEPDGTTIRITDDK